MAEYSCQFAGRQKPAGLEGANLADFRRVSWGQTCFVKKTTLESAELVRFWPLHNTDAKLLSKLDLPAQDTFAGIAKEWLESKNTYDVRAVGTHIYNAEMLGS